MDITEIFRSKIYGEKISISELSKKTGINKQALYNVLNSRTNITWAQVELISEAVGLIINIDFAVKKPSHIEIREGHEEANYEVVKFDDGKETVIETIDLEMVPIYERFGVFIEAIKPFLFGRRQIILKM